MSYFHSKKDVNVMLIGPTAVTYLTDCACLETMLYVGKVQNALVYQIAMSVNNNCFVG